MRSSLRLSLAALLITQSACSIGSSDAPADGNWIGDVVAITASDELVTFFEQSPQSLASRVGVSGLSAGEHVLSIDFRAPDGALLGWTSDGRIVEIDPLTGAASALGWADLGTATGAISAFDLNPATNELRVATNAAESVRLESGSGALAGNDASFAYAVGDPNEGVAPDLIALAHDNAFDTTERTTLFGIDEATDSFVEISESGILETRGLLSTPPTGPVGFDIRGFDGALVSIPGPGGIVELHRLGSDGSLSALGPIDPTADVIDIAARPAVAPRILGVSAAGDLVELSASSPGLVHLQAPVTGLQAGEGVAGLTVEILTGRILALGDSSRLYTLDPETGVATPLATSAFAPPLSGSRFSITAEPLDNALRVISDAQQNLRIDLASADTAVTANSWIYDVGDLHSAELPHLVGCALQGPDMFNRDLWALDAATDSLVHLGATQGRSPNDGIATTVGALGLDFDDESDLAPVGRTHMLAILRPAGTSTSSVRRLDTTTAELHELGDAATSLTSAVVEPLPSPEVIGLTTGNRLVRFRAGKPGTITSDITISGLSGSELLLGIDRRPADGGLYGLSDSGRLYRIHAPTGATAAVGPPVALVGTRFAIDFDPRADELRVVSDAGQNLRIDPDTGAQAGNDTSLAFDVLDPAAGTAPRPLALAYANNAPGTLCSAAFALEQASGGLVTLGSRDGCSIPATSGSLFTVLDVGGIETDARIGFDIAANGVSLASYTPEDQSFTLIIDIPLCGEPPRVTGICGATERLIDIAIVR